MNCKLCNSQELTELKGQVTYYYCQQCELIFADSAVILSHKEEKQRYEQHNNTRENSGYVNMFKQFIKKVIKPSAREMETALDFGCGPGPVLAEDKYCLLKKE